MRERQSCRWGTMSVMATPPESTKISVGQRLRAYAQERWPQAGELEFRYRGAFVYVQANLPDETVQPLIRLRYSGSARHWGFGLYLASSIATRTRSCRPGSPAAARKKLWTAPAASIWTTRPELQPPPKDFRNGPFSGGALKCHKRGRGELVTSRPPAHGTASTWHRAELDTRPDLPART
jgi:hypothetical protein